jgi:hypothetical protein
MGYKILGFAVWKGAKWYLGRRYPKARPVALGAVVAIAVLTVAVKQARAGRDGSRS